MQPLLINTQTGERHSINIKKVSLPYLDTPFHFHKEYEMVLILKSNGKRIVGDNIENFTDGDLVIMGPDLPHVWYNEKDYYLKESTKDVKAIVVYFHPEWLSEEFLKSEESNKVREILYDLKRGIKVLGKTKKKITKQMEKLSESTGLKRIIRLLNIIHILSKTKEYEHLASIGYINSYSEKDVERINKIYQYIMANFMNKITLDDVAEVANMTPTAFCKYFKARTQKTFSSFVNEVRIGYACKLLFNENLSISQICYESGFNNLTNFNRTFKEITNKNPSEYRYSLKLGV